MSAEALARYAVMAVPRYTSYPTAASFSAEIGPERHAGWLAGLAADQPVSLYLHVPYCRQLCHYCGCHAKLALREDVVARYRAALGGEIEQVGRLLRHRPKVTRIAWGGGTPSILGADGLESILAVVGRHFQIADTAEHSIELDPRHVPDELPDRLRALGVNRASLGVQDVEPAVQQAIGRIQPIELVERCTTLLRAAGIGRLNFDLIYGLPGQDVASIEATCRQVIALGPDRVAFYGYAHLPGRRANQRLIDEALLPGPAERFRQSQALARSFALAGYAPVGIDHFARPDDPLAIAAAAGRLHRNFQGYTDDDCPVLLGFGASAISSLPGGYVQNVADNPRYCRTVGTGELATVRGYALTDEDRRRARIIERLMCDFRVDLRAVDPDGDHADELALLRPMAADGMLTIADRTIAMTPLGRLVVRAAAAVFDTFRQREASRFSLAV